jgi:hypothetical protein
MTSRHRLGDNTDDLNGRGARGSVRRICKLVVIPDIGHYLAGRVIVRTASGKFAGDSRRCS